MSHMVNLVIAPKNATQPRLNIEAAVVPDVTCDLPLEGATHLKDFPHLKDLELADPSFYKTGKIDILLGCNVYQVSETRKGSSDQPVARETIFGWAVIVRYKPNHSPSALPSAPVLLNLALSPSTDAILQRFWDAPGQPTCLTQEEQVVVEHFNKTHVFSAGRYKVNLPRKPDAPKLGNSLTQALQRYHSNERSISRKGSWEAFQSVAQEYLDLSLCQPHRSHYLQNPPTTCPCTAS